MTDSERTSLANAWIALQKSERNSDEYNSLFWSFGQMFDLIYEDPLEAWKTILTIWFLDQSTVTMQNLSAGPIEDLLSQHGEMIIPLVENEARNDPSFAKMLGGVWQHTMTDKVWNRLQAVWDRRGWDGIPE